MKDADDIAVEQEQIYETAERLYPEEPREPTPTVSELQEKARKEDAEFPERMAKLQEQVEQKAQQFQQQAQGPDDGESAPRWSDADLRDLHTYARAQQNQQARAQQWQQSVVRALQEHGASNLAELQQKAPKVALRLKDDFQQVAADAQTIQQVARNIETNLTIREVESARAQLHREIPDLADDARREEFVEWAAKEAGTTPDQVRAVRDPTLVKAYWKAYAAQRKNTPRPKGKIPKTAKAQTKQGKSSVPKEIRKTAIGQKMLALENMYGPPAKKSAPPKPKLPSRHPVNILYGESV